MTIKQQGGIFGRNPTFNDVDVDSSLDVGSGVLVVDAVNDRVGVNTPAPAFDDGLDLSGGADNASPTSLIFKQGNSTTKISRINGYQDNTNEQGLRITTNYYGNQFAYFRPVGDLQIAGNLVVASGKGIDFSATSGTGTSELFDDYEEGTWTPVYDASTSSPTVTHDKQTGYYVKIGRMVFISLQLRTDSVSGGSGNLRISGLPYSASSGDGYPSALSVGYKADFVTNGPDFAHVNDGQTYLSLYSNGTTVATPLTVANLNTGSNDNGLYISGSYLTA
jgi:hypothetical protein